MPPPIWPSLYCFFNPVTSITGRFSVVAILRPSLHGIHKGLFDAAEQHHAQHQRRRGEHQAVHDAKGGDRAGTQRCHAENFDGRGHGVELDQNFQAGAGFQHGQRVDHGGGVHPQLYAEAHGNGEVAVLGGERRHDDADAQAQQHDLEDDEGDGQQPQREVYAAAGGEEVDPENQVHGRLDEEVDEAGQHLADGHRQARKVHLAEYLRVGDKGVGRVVDAVGEESPHGVAGHVKQETGHAVGGHIGHAAEHHVEDDGGDKRVEDDPRGAQNRLFIQHGEVALDEHHDKVTVLPKLVQVDVKPPGFGADDGRPAIGREGMIVFSHGGHLFLLYSGR